MASFGCPFCQHTMALSNQTYREIFMSQQMLNARYTPPAPGQICIKYYSCPHCGEITIMADVEYDPSIGTVYLRPQSLAKKFPNYIPQAIRDDYEEAHAIVSLSPKASATLSRRCIQGMIRDFWNIDESNLSRSISQLEGKIPAPQWRVIDGVRRIGNIGAQMEKDVNHIVDIEPEEAKKLLKLIEHLLEQWYINRHEQEQLYADIIGIDEVKQAERKKSE